MLTAQFKTITDPFEAITLAEMEEVALMNRIDTKYAINETTFLEILPLIKDSYRILTVGGLKYSGYESLYFDSPDMSFFNDHHKGKNNRLKIRIRKYINNNLSFLEVKRKQKGRTKKSRLKTDHYDSKFNEKEYDFLKASFPEAKKLKSALSNSFNRITLVHKYKAERLTFDLNIEFKDSSKTKSLTNLVICELKQGTADRSSTFYTLMKKRLIRPLRTSKYCMGMTEFYSAVELKQNRFKKKTLSINKII